MSQELVCVRRVSALEKAEVIVAWLEDNGVAAQVVDRDNPGVFLFGVTDAEGIAICVAGQAEASKATELLAKHDEEIAEQHGTTDIQGLIDVQCEDCGAQNSFPAAAAGSVQQPSC